MTKVSIISARDPLFVWLGRFFMLLGTIVTATAVSRIMSDWERYNSPFDQVHKTGKETNGFVPILYAPDNKTSPNLPPPQCSGNCSSLSESLDQENLLPAAQCSGSCSGVWERVTTPQIALDPPLQDELSTNLSVSESKGTTGFIPDHISIPSIQLNAPVIPVPPRAIEYEERTYFQWTAPDSYAAGWHDSSALLGLSGNTVINGHHNVWGNVFGYLSILRPGDWIYVSSGNRRFAYVVGETMILPERFESLETRLENAQWIMPSEDERLTLVTCWPQDSNTHRVIVVAVPADDPGS